MIKKYIIDGNNLMGKMPELRDSGKTSGQKTRERLAFIIDRYFHGKKAKVSLHFDGHPGEPIRTAKSNIIYSYSAPADTGIKKEIENSKNPRVIALVSSDLNLLEFAKVNACGIIKSEEFVKMIQPGSSDDEENRISEIDKEEIKKLFGVDK